MNRIALILALLTCLPCVALGKWNVAAPEQRDPALQWGIQRLESMLARPETLPESKMCEVKITVDPANSELPEVIRKPEGFRIISRDPERIDIIAYDAAGSLYACLDLAARLKNATKIPGQLDISDAPAMSLRGTCILLMKLGLYDYPVTPGEFPFFYDKDLWTQYLDFLAENRFNFVALWNGHPFDYFVKLDKYPEAQDGLGLELLQRNHDMLMWLGQEAAKRNIWLMFEFYNIHTSVYFAKAHNLPEHGISEPTPLLEDYTRYAIERFVSEFPSVGLYVCPGEALELKYTADWINDVILAAVKATGKTPPVMIRSWGIDLENTKKVVGNYPRLYTERKFNVEMIASKEVDPENADWARLSGNHVVSIHCVGNLEPFRWNPPGYIRQCIRSSRDVGATGLHLYPRKAWRWPYGCDKEPPGELQWKRDRLWFEMWGRYAWNPDCGEDEGAFWLDRLTRDFGPAASARLLDSFEAGADVLPAIQRLLWVGNDNHTVVAAGATLEQIQTAKGIPFLKEPDMVRIPDHIAALKKGETVPGTNPVDFLAQKVSEAETALKLAEQAADAATANKDEAQRIAADAKAVWLIARFYRDKTSAAVAKALADAGVNDRTNTTSFELNLQSSLAAFRELTELTKETYDSMSDVPAWNPSRELPCPYHWSDVLPLFEEEYDGLRR